MNAMSMMRWWLALSGMLCIACGRSELLLLDDGARDEGFDSTALVGERCDLDSPMLDCDGDGIPDRDDPFPSDPQRPGTVDPDLFYMHTSGALSTIDFRSLTSRRVGDFSFPDLSPGVGITDIAIDSHGVMYATSFAGLFTCDPETATCWRLADANANAAGVLPAGVVDPDDDALVVIERGVEWTHMQLRGGEVTPVRLGTLPPGLSSSGDLAFSRSGATYFTSPLQGQEGMVEVDPRSGTPVATAVPIELAIAAYGLAGGGDSIFVFDAFGAILRFDPRTNESFVIVQLEQEWWGAASHPSQLD